MRLDWMSVLAALVFLASPCSSSAEAHFSIAARCFSAAARNNFEASAKLLVMTDSSSSSSESYKLKTSASSRTSAPRCDNARPQAMSATITATDDDEEVEACCSFSSAAAAAVRSSTATARKYLPASTSASSAVSP